MRAAGLLATVGLLQDLDAATLRRQGVTTTGVGQVGESDYPLMHPPDPALWG